MGRSHVVCPRGLISKGGRDVPRRRGSRATVSECVRQWDARPGRPRLSGVGGRRMQRCRCSALRERCPDRRHANPNLSNCAAPEPGPERTGNKGCTVAGRPGPGRYSPSRHHRRPAERRCSESRGWAKRLHGSDCGCRRGCLRPRELPTRSVEKRHPNAGAASVVLARRDVSRVASPIQ